jgi:hypothetical protein
MRFEDNEKLIERLKYVDPKFTASINHTPWYLKPIEKNWLESETGSR